MGKGKKSKKYSDKSWFWGLISESDAEKILKSEGVGTFLLRSELCRQETIVILSYVSTFKDSHKIFHKQCNLVGNKWELEGDKRQFGTIVDMIAYYQENIINANHKLTRFKSKPSWYLKAADIVAPDDAKVLGAGNFSQVILGKYLKKNVAIKKLFASGDALLKEKEALVKEARTMEQLKHPYIIKFFGISLDCLPPMIVMELMAGGLLPHLKEHGPITSNGEKLHYCKQLANAMTFMAEKKIVHRDLAARNCLFSVYGILKVTDFGLSDSEANLIAYCTVQDQMPARWMAPEGVQKTATFNEKSDVWSFGVVCNEIFENGVEPLHHLTDTKDVVEALRRGPANKNGIIHIPAANAPPDIAKLFSSCWKWDGADRPNFAELLTMIDMLLKNKYLLPPLEELSVRKIKNVRLLTTAEYDILTENHLDSELSGEVSSDDTRTVGSISVGKKSAERRKRKNRKMEGSAAK